MFQSTRCSRTAKVDGTPTKCGIHSKAGAERRQAKVDAKRREQEEKWERQLAEREAKHEIMKIAREIAESRDINSHAQLDELRAAFKVLDSDGRK
jgi:hypothetical protein